MPPMKEREERERERGRIRNEPQCSFSQGYASQGSVPEVGSDVASYIRDLSARSLLISKSYSPGGWTRCARRRGGGGGGQGTLGSIQRSERIVGRPIVELPFMRLLWAQWVGERIGFAKWRGEGGKIIIIKKKGKQKKGIKNRKKHGSRETDEVGWTGKEVLRLFSILIWSSVWFDLDRISMNGIFLRKNMSLSNIYNFTDLLLID